MFIFVTNLEEKSIFICDKIYLKGDVMNCSKWFKDFYDNLIIKDSIISAITEGVEEISEIINFEYWNKNSRTDNVKLIGSLSRSTSIDTSKVEVMAILPHYMYKRYYLYSGNGPFSLVEDVYIRIKKTFIEARIIKEGNRVEFTYKNVNFQVIPAFIGEDEIYTYPETSMGGSWLSQDFDKSLEVFNKRDDEMKGNMKKFAKMLRVWNRNFNCRLSEILLDAIVYEFFENYSFGKIRGFAYFDLYFADFFKYLLKRGPEYYWYIPGTTISINPRSPYLLNKKVKESLDITKKAIDLYLDEYILLARDQWELLFGDKFLEHKDFNIE